MIFHYNHRPLFSWIFRDVRLFFQNPNAAGNRYVVIKYVFRKRAITK